MRQSKDELDSAGDGGGVGSENGQMLLSLTPLLNWSVKGSPEASWPADENVQAFKSEMRAASRHVAPQ